MRSPIAHLPDSELAVMQVFWRAGKPLTRPEIDAGLAGQKNWTVSTVVALLIRLENRGFVSHEKQGRGYLYRPLVTQEEYLAAESKTLLGTLYGGDPKNFIAALYGGGALSGEDIRELQEYLDRAKRGDG
ncbi:BlaI/MecI/CopY family transcriptional regulator [Anaerofilum sp. BX8]|uniref:BlaI/MecI/CopY family transcriptional regulator n=1 Tax=Anaerofilum hominis TaxID=2763016 RepID=A0A923I5R2_9FIRM|nr:BlaI/MecI/CopY family transcriptional regulator [Anaerofilum hominis]